MWGVKLFSGTLILIVIALLVVGISDSIVLSDYQDMAPVPLSALKTGDIFLGFNDFSRFENRTQANLFFSAHSVVTQRQFTHLGIVYVDKNYEPSNPRRYYVWNISCVPWNNPAVMKYEWAQLGSRMMPLAGMCALYQFCCITPVKREIDNKRLESIMAGHDDTHRNMARSAPHYLYRGMKAFLDPNKPDTENDKLFCTDIAERIMREAGVFRSKQSVVLAPDLYIGEDGKSKKIEYAPGQGLCPTRRLYVDKESPTGRNILKLMKEFGFDREYEEDLLFMK